MTFKLAMFNRYWLKYEGGGAPVLEHDDGGREPLVGATDLSVPRAGDGVQPCYQLHEPTLTPRNNKQYQRLLIYQLQYRTSLN